MLFPVRVAEVDAEEDVVESLRDLADRFYRELRRLLKRGEIRFQAVGLGVGEPGQQRFVELDRVDAGPGEREDLVAENRHAGADETFPGRVSLCRVPRMPQEVGDRAGGGQGDDHPAIGIAAQELRLVADYGAAPLELLDDEGMQHQGAAPGFLPAEAAHLVGEDTGVVLAAALPVGEVVEAGALLHQDRRPDRGIEEPVRLGAAQAPGDAVGNDVLHPSRTGQAAHHHGGEEGVQWRCGHLGGPSVFPVTVIRT